MNFVQPCPVLARSTTSLDIAGIQLFMDAKNGHYFLSLRCMASGIKRGFSVHPTTGANTRKYRNQYAVPILPKRIQSPSAGMAPTYISKKKSPTRNHVNCFHMGL